MGFESIDKECALLSEFLRSTQATCSSFDLTTTDISERINYVKEFEIPFTAQVSMSFNKIWDLASPSVGSLEMDEISKLVDNKLKPYFHVGNSYNQRVYDKPLGYDGDYLTIYHLFLKYIGQSTYDILINQYSRNIAIAKGHYFRIDYLLNEFNANHYKKILSVGCGPAIELQRHRHSQNFQETQFSLIDMDKRALDFVKEKLGPDSQNINYFEISVMALIKACRKNTLEINDQDLIYCCGLFDYLEDKVGQLILNGLYNKLSPHGKLIITNVCKDVTEKAYFQILGKWNLILRNEEGLIKLAESCIVNNNFRVFRDDYSKTNVFIEIIKQK